MLAPLSACENKSDNGDLGEIIVSSGRTGDNPPGFTDTGSTVDQRETGVYDGPPGTWAIYWYLCGTDLESRGGLATTDLEEMLKVSLPDNVTVVIQTGGTRTWKNRIFSSDSIGRYTYTGSDLRLVETQPLASMGHPDTFADFLEFCNVNYPAEKQGVILWDHGGGSLVGMQVDELFDRDVLTLPEFKMALEAAPAASGMYEFVGFDACLMATIDIAAILIDDARYMIASEEVEPGIGWDYTGLFSALAADTTIGGGDLGVAICDSFYTACSRRGFEKEVTLSVIDIKKAGALLDAYNAVGNEALTRASEERESYLSAFGRAAFNTEEYGDGRYGMVDLGHLVSNASDLLPQSGAALLEALNACVYYNVFGEYRSKASGLACCYLSSSDQAPPFSYYQALSTSLPFRYYFEYAAEGVLSGDALAYLDWLGAQGQTTIPLPPTDEMGFNGHSVAVSPYDRWYMELGPDLASNLAAVFTKVIWVNPSTAEETLWGTNQDLTTDWERGVFTEDFKNEWGAIDSVNINMELVAVEPGRILYAAPAYLNGERGKLGIGFCNGVYEILSFTVDGDEETRLASKDMRLLEPGDVLEPILPGTVANRDGTFSFYDSYGGRIVVSENTGFSRRNLRDGYFKITFQMIDYAGSSFFSDVCVIRVLDGEIMRISDGQIPDIPDETDNGTEIWNIRRATWTAGGRDFVYYMADVSAEVYAELAGWIGVNPAGDSLTGTHTIQLLCFELYDLDDYVGEQRAFIGGAIYARSTIEDMYDISFIVKDIYIIW